MIKFLVICLFIVVFPTIMIFRRRTERRSIVAFFKNQKIRLETARELTIFRLANGLSLEVDYNLYLDDDLVESNASVMRAWTWISGQKLCESTSDCSIEP